MSLFLSRPYSDCRDLGAFILVDRYSKTTVGAGMINYGLRRAQNLYPTVRQLTACIAAIDGAFKAR